MPKQYLGYSDQDRRSEYAPFYDEKITTLPAEVTAALAGGAMPWGTLPDVGDLPDLEKSGYAAVEYGYSVDHDGSIAVAVKTDMPGVAPALWDLSLIHILHDLNKVSKAIGKWVLERGESPPCPPSGG